MDNKKHSSKTISSLKWNLLEQVFSQGITLILGITLMRLLKPEQFGLLGMVTVFSGFLNVFSDFGLSSSLIQKQDIHELDKSTIFWTSCTIGVILAAILFFSSGYLGDFYNEPGLKAIAKVQSASFIITSLATVHISLLRKTLSYKKIVLISILASTISAAVAMVMAFNNYGVWAIVAQQLLNALLLTIFFWMAISFKPTITFSGTRLKNHLKFGLPLFGSGTFSYWIGNGDNLLIGKFLGANALGLYSRAYTLVTLPTHRISVMITSVMFPSFALIKDDYAKVKRIFLKMSRVLASLILPMMGILFIGAKSIVLLLVGNKWIDIVPIIQVLTGVASIKALSILNSSILVSHGRTDLDFKINVVSGLLLLLCFFLGVQFGILQVAIAYLVGVVLISIPGWYIISKIISCSLKEFVANILPQILVTLFLVFTGALTFRFFFGNLPDAVKILLIVLQFGLGWIILFSIFFKSRLQELIAIVVELKTGEIIKINKVNNP